MRTQKEAEHLLTFAQKLNTEAMNSKWLSALQGRVRFVEAAPPP